MSNRANDGELPVRRIDRILAFMSLGLILLSIICFAAIMIGTTAGADFGAGIWPTVGLLVYVAPVIGFALLLTLLIMSMVRRGRPGAGG